MWVVIFRATVREFDEEYAKTAARMRELALGEFGCIEFHSVTEGREEVALSYWTSEAHIKAWRSHPEHLAAQRLGRERWYERYSVEVAEIARRYASVDPASAG